MTGTSVPQDSPAQPAAPDTVPPPATIAELVQHAHARLADVELGYGHGCDDPYDEAVWLVAVAIEMPVDRIDPGSDAPIEAIEFERAKRLLDARIDARLPLAYLAGEAWLRGRRFLSDPRALVPRSPIAELLDAHFAPWVPDDAPVATILDLCTGGGSLAVIAAQAFPDAQVTASDLSAPALELAADNVALHGLEDRITLCEGDLWAPLGDARFDLVVCNPPYVDAEAMAELPPEWRHEPASALAGDVGPGAGGDGLALVRRILAGALAHLAPHGRLVLEIGHQGDAFEAAFPRLAFAWLPVAAGDRMIALIERDALVAAGPIGVAAPGGATGQAS